MKTLFSIICLISVWTISKSQDNLFYKYDSTLKSIQLKWYPQDLFENAKYNVYRKIDNGDWEKINASPVIPGKAIPTQQQLHEDHLLASNIELVKSKQENNGLGKLSILMYSFNSEALCNYMGHYYVDKSPPVGKTFRYKVVREMATANALVGETEDVKNEQVKHKDGLGEVSYRFEKNNVIFTCIPNTKLYYGIKVYKRQIDSLSEKLITPYPILINARNDNNAVSNGTDVFKEKVQSDGAIYDYRFETINYFGDSHSDAKTVRVTSPDLIAPKPPHQLTSEVKGRIIGYKWQKEEIENDFVGFNLYRTKNNDTDFIKINPTIIDKKIRSFRDSIADFHSYSYKIASVDKNGNESFSEPQWMEVPDLESPITPRHLIIESDTGKIKLSWDKNIERDIWGYLIYRSINDTTLGGFVKITPNPITENTLDDLLPVNAKNRFFYRVIAIDQNFNKSAFSPFVSARMPDVFAPKAVVITDVIIKENTISLTWLANSENDVHHYNVVRYDNDTNSRAQHPIEITTKSTTWVDADIKGTHHYEYQVFAIDSSGNKSAGSAKRSIKPKLDQQDVESNDLKTQVRYHPQNKELLIEWYPKQKDKILGSIVFQRELSERVLSPITGLLNESEFSHTNISVEKTVFIQVRTYYKNGETEVSKPIEIKITNKNKLKKLKR